MGHGEMATGNCLNFSKKIHFIFIMLSNRFIFHLTYIQMYYKEVSHLFCKIFAFHSPFIWLPAVPYEKKMFNNTEYSVIHLLWQTMRSKNQL